MTYSRTLLGLVAGLVLLAAGCNVVVPTATPEPTATATPSPTPPPTVAPTRTVLPRTPRAPTPTPTPTVQIAAFEGASQLYENTTYGVRFSYPAGWEKTEGDPAGGVLASVSSPGLTVQVQLFVEFPQDETIPAQMARAFLATLEGSLANLKTVREGEATLPGGVPAYNLVIQGGTPAPLTARALYAVRGTYVFTLFARASAEDYTRAERAIDAVFTSLVLAQPRPAGVSLQDTLTLWGSTPLTLDPALSGEVTSHTYILQLFSGLVQLDHNLKPVPDLATWEVSDDGTRYTFRLRPGAVFHDGRPVTAQDVAYSFNRAASPKTASRTAKDFLGDIVGVTEVLGGQADSIRGVRVLNDQTLEVQIDARKAYFLAKLAYPAAFVVDRASVEAGGREWWRKPNGTGPFRLKQWDADQVLVLERNDRFYGFKAFLANVVFRLFGAVPVRMYEKDEADVATVFLDDLDRVESRSPLKEQLKTTPELAVWYVGFDATKPPFDDPLVRKAFLLAVDRQKVLDSVYEGRFPLAQGLLPPGLPGHDATIPPISFDPAQAKQLLTQSRYGGAQGLPPIVFTEAGFVTSSAFVDALIAEWRRNLGVEVRVRLIPPEVYYTGLKRNRGNLFEFGWVADYPDAQNFLDLLFHSDRENNSGEYKNTAFDALVDQAATLRDETERHRLYRQAERLLLDDAALIPIRFGVNHFLVKPYVRCYEPDAQGQIDFSRVRLQSSVLPGSATEPCF